jgi:hypothetical protein
MRLYPVLAARPHFIEPQIVGLAQAFEARAQKRSHVRGLASGKPEETKGFDARRALDHPKGAVITQTFEKHQQSRNVVAEFQRCGILPADHISPLADNTEPDASARLRVARGALLLRELIWQPSSLSWAWRILSEELPHGSAQGLQTAG